MTWGEMKKEKIMVQDLEKVNEDDQQDLHEVVVVNRFYTTM